MGVLYPKGHCHGNSSEVFDSTRKVFVLHNQTLSELMQSKTIASDNERVNKRYFLKFNVSQRMISGINLISLMCLLSINWLAMMQIVIEARMGLINLFIFCPPIIYLSVMAGTLSELGLLPLVEMLDTKHITNSNQTLFN